MPLAKQELPEVPVKPWEDWRGASLLCPRGWEPESLGSYEDIQSDPARLMSQRSRSHSGWCSLPGPFRGLSTYPACSYRVTYCGTSEPRVSSQCWEMGRQRNSERNAERCAGLTYSHLGMFPRRGGFELSPSETTVGFMTGKDLE